MNIDRVLVAVDDSPAALRAARVAVELAGDWHARVRFVSAVQDHGLGAMLDATLSDGAATERLEQASSALLRHLVETAREEQVEADAMPVSGEPFRAIIDEARRWPADVVVMGRSDRRGPSSPYLGSVTAHVLEFADCPVLVVPWAPARDRPADG